MERKEITAILSKLLEKHLDPNNDPRIYWAKEVTFDYGTDHAVRVDYMLFKPVDNSVAGIEKGDFYCYEVKSCIEDFKSPHGHNFIGDYNYYVMPEDVYEYFSKTNALPYKAGVYAYSNNSLVCVRKAKRSLRRKAVAEMLLMMFRSSNRDKVKSKSSETAAHKN